jgi:hypothetical protein
MAFRGFAPELVNRLIKRITRPEAITNRGGAPKRSALGSGPDGQDRLAEAILTLGRSPGGPPGQDRVLVMIDTLHPLLKLDLVLGPQKVKELFLL